MNSPPLDLLVTFAVFTESANISEAARKLGLSQPAVSIQLKRLEAFMPQPLFVFQGKKKTLSHYGRAVYDSVRDRLRSVEAGIERVNLLYSHPENLKIRVGARREVFLLLASRLRFKGKVEFQALSNTEVHEKLLKNEIEVGISYSRPDDPGLLSKEILSQSTELCVPRVWLKRHTLTPEIASDPLFLKATPCLAYKTQRPPFLTEWAEHCGVAPGQLNIKAVCDDWTVILQMVQAGMGYSILPSGVMSGASGIHVYKIPEKVIPKRAFYLLYSKSLRHVPGIRELFG